MSIERAIEIAGSQTALAAAVGVTPQMVNQWARKVRPVSAIMAKAIEKATNGAVKRYELRPDIYDAPTTEGQAA